MRLPSHSYDTVDLVRNMSIPADGPEQVITADEYLHPQSAAARHQRGLTAPGAKIPYHINGALEMVSSWAHQLRAFSEWFYITGSVGCNTFRIFIYWMFSLQPVTS